MERQPVSVSIVIVASGAGRELPRGLQGQLCPGDEVLWAEGSQGLEAALRRVAGGFVLLAEACDAWHPARRGACVAALEQGAMAAVHDAVVVDGDLNEVEGSLLHRLRGSALHRLLCPPYAGCCMALRREVLDAALPFPERIDASDFWLGAVAARLGRVAFLGRTLIFHRSPRTVAGRHRIFGCALPCLRGLRLRALACRRVRLRRR